MRELDPISSPIKTSQVMWGKTWERPELSRAISPSIPSRLHKKLLTPTTKLEIDNLLEMQFNQALQDNLTKTQIFLPINRTQQLFSPLLPRHPRSPRWGWTITLNRVSWIAQKLMRVPLTLLQDRLCKGKMLNGRVQFSEVQLKPSQEEGVWPRKEQAKEVSLEIKKKNGRRRNRSQHWWARRRTQDLPNLTKLQLNRERLESSMARVIESINLLLCQKRK